MSYYPQQQQPQHSPLPSPWYAEWDQRDQRYVYINPQTNQRTFEHPHPTYQQQGNYGGYGRGYNQQQQQGGYGAGYGQPEVGYQQGGYQTRVPPPAQNSHKAMEYGALGAVGGLVTGALAMHEGEKLHKDWDHDKDRIEARGRYDEERVERRYDGDRDRFEGREEYGEERAERFEDRERMENVYEEGQAERRFDERREDVYEERREDAYEERREDVYEERREDAYEERRDEERYDDDF